MMRKSRRERGHEADPEGSARSNKTIPVVYLSLCEFSSDPGEKQNNFGAFGVVFLDKKHLRDVGKEHGVPGGNKINKIQP